MMDWLADIGGLIVALMLIAGAIVGPMAKMSLRAELVGKIFRYLASKPVVSNEIAITHRQQAGGDILQDDESLGEDSDRNLADPDFQKNPENQKEAQLAWDFNKPVNFKSKVKAPACSKASFGCRATKEERILEKAQRRITKELDIVKFVHR